MIQDSQLVEMISQPMGGMHPIGLVELFQLVEGGLDVRGWCGRVECNPDQK